MPLINKASIRTSSSLKMTWKPDMKNNGDFETIGFNVTFTEVESQKVLYENTNASDIRLLFVENLKPYTLYRLSVSAFNRFTIHSPDAKQNFVTSEAGKFHTITLFSCSSYFGTFLFIFFYHGRLEEYHYCLYASNALYFYLAPSKILEVTTASITTSSTLHLSWQRPIPSNGKLSNYTIQYRLSNSNTSMKELDTVNNEIEFMELQPFTVYQIRVCNSNPNNYDPLIIINSFYTACFRSIF